MKVQTTLRNRSLVVALGIVLGLVLSSLSFLGIAAGHGTYIPISVSSAPICLIGPTAAIIGSVLLWPFLFWLALMRDLSLTYRRIFIVAVIVHYSSALYSVNFGQFSKSISFEQSEKSFLFLLAWFVVYGGSNFLLWTFAGYKNRTGLK